MMKLLMRNVDENFLTRDVDEGFFVEKLMVGGKKSKYMWFSNRLCFQYSSYLQSIIIRVQLYTYYDGQSH